MAEEQPIRGQDVMLGPIRGGLSLIANFMTVFSNREDIKLLLCYLALECRNLGKSIK